MQINSVSGFPSTAV